MAHVEPPQQAAAGHGTSTTTSPLVGLVSGCAGAVALVYVGQPLDTIKVRMQLSTASQAVTASGGGGGHVSMWGCVRDMWRQALVAPDPRPGPLVKAAGGDVVTACSMPSPAVGQTPAGRAAASARMARLMYAGTAPALLANVAENGVLFAAYGPCQRLVAFAVDLLGPGGGDGAEKKLGPAGMATAGSLASLCSAFALCPTELIKVRLQAADLERSKAATATTVGGSSLNSAKRQRPPVAGTLQVVARVWTEEGGLRGMYRGLGSTVAREMPGYYVFFLAYEASRTAMNKWHYRGTALADADQEDPTWVTMTAGAAAGTCLWLVVYPVDAVKSRIQATGAGECSSSGNFLKAMVRAVRNEGPLALYRGLAPTLLRTVPASAVMFWTVERTNTLLTGYGL